MKVNTSCGLAGRTSFISGELKDGGIAYVYVGLERSYDPPECHPGQQAYTFVIDLLSTSLTSVSIFPVSCCSRYVSLWQRHCILQTGNLRLYSAFQRRKFKYRSRIHERTILLRFQDVILWVLRLEVSIIMFTLKTSVNHFCLGGEGGGVKLGIRSDCEQQGGKLLRILFQFSPRIWPIGQGIGYRLIGILTIFCRRRAVMLQGLCTYSFSTDAQLQASHCTVNCICWYRAQRKVERQVKVLLKNQAIFFLCPSKQFLLISFQNSAVGI